MDSQESYNVGPMISSVVCQIIERKGRGSEDGKRNEFKKGIDLNEEKGRNLEETSIERAGKIRF